MTESFRTSVARKPADPRARQRLREAQALESRAVATVCAAEAKVGLAVAKRDKAVAVADGWVTGAREVLDRARSDLASVSGVDRAALLLGIGKPELRRSMASRNSQDGDA